MVTINKNTNILIAIIYPNCLTCIYLSCDMIKVVTDIDIFPIKFGLNILDLLVLHLTWIPCMVSNTENFHLQRHLNLISSYLFVLISIYHILSRFITATLQKMANNLITHHISILKQHYIIKKFYHILLFHWFAVDEQC